MTLLLRRVLLAAVVIRLGAGDKYIANNLALARAYQEQSRMMESQTLKIKRTQDRNDEMFTKYDALQTALGKRMILLQLVANIMDCRPREVLLEVLEIPNSGYITVRGRAEEQVSIKEFKRRIEQSSLGTAPAAEARFESSILTNIDTRAVADSRFDTKVYQFTIQMSSFARRGRYRSIKNSGATRYDSSGQVQETGASTFDRSSFSFGM